MSHSAPKYAPNKGVAAAIKKAVGKDAISVEESHGEIAVTVKRDALVPAMIALRDVCEYQQLMEIAGVDWPDHDPRFEVVYCLLSVTKNHRIRVHVWTNEDEPVPSVTGIWPVAGWLEREVFDMYGVTLPAMMTFVVSLPTMALSAIRSARISRSPDMWSCVIRKKKSA